MQNKRLRWYSGPIPYTMKVSLKKSFAVFKASAKLFYTNYFEYVAFLKFGLKRMREEDKVVLPDPYTV